MTHYSDMGMEFSNQQEHSKFLEDLCNDNIKGYSFLEDIKGGKFLHKELGNIVFNIMQIKKNLKIGFTYKNKDIVEGVVLSCKENPHDTYTLNVDINGIPFWFDCSNAVFFKIKKKKKVKFSSACFADYVEIWTKEELNKHREENEEELKMADESYISDFNTDPTTAYILSGIITNFKKDKNPLTDKEFWVIDISCLGLKTKLLVDTKEIDEASIKKGSIIRTRCFCTAIIEEVLK